MKKNKVMRIASVLLIVTLLSTCAISGTFAKYVTTADGNDSARVAAWGIIIDIEGTAFKDEYEGGPYTHHSGSSETITVQSADGALVLAPGTDSGENSFKATVAGTPEVATKFELVLDDDATKEILIPAGTVIKDYTQLVRTVDDTTGDVSYDYADYTVTEDYRPVKLGLKVSQNGSVVAQKTGMTLAQLKTALQNYGGNIGGIAANMAPNETVDYTFELVWEWPFESGHDIEDTYLGNAISGQINAAAGVVLEESYGFTASATQID